jgi:pimeloyl-ACP methyl ester carboxylesterase
MRRRGPHTDNAEKRFATSRGSRIHYSVEGDGPLVVLLHGLLSDGQAPATRW